MIFRDRRAAGQQLATRLAFLKDELRLIVLGIPRGGVVVAAEVARALKAPFDIFLAHKIGAPFNPELAVGAVTSEGALWFDEEFIRELRLSEKDLARAVEQQREEMARRLIMFRRARPPLDVKNKTVVLIDDGVATGATVLASLRALRQHQPARLILAIPVGPRETLQHLASECDQLIVLETPEPFWGVGQFYARFDQTSDAEVVALLAESTVTR